MRLAICCSIIALHLVWAGSATGADPYNLKPAAGDWILPMPNGVSMVFRPVFIGEKGDNPFAFKKFQVGTPEGNYNREYQKLVGLGGAFKTERERQPGKRELEWLYYLGKYEVMTDQYYALMDPSKVTKQEGQLPINDISWFQAQEFIHQYNEWLFKNARDKLPKNDETIGFVRLPTEIEWEFAARGGDEVTPEQFAKRLPYEGALSKYEWFGTVSSSATPHKVGQLEPNILQLYDMLGNVSEMTASYYQMEYYQGRIGGFVVRGGTFATRDIYSALRYEYPFYNRQKNYAPWSSPSLGMRLALAVPVFAGQKTEQEIKQEWEKYKAILVTNVPSGGSPLPPIQTGVELAKAVEIVKSLLNNSTLSPQIVSQLQTLYYSFEKIEASRKETVADTISNLFQLATERAIFIATALYKARAKIEAYEIAQKAHVQQDTLANYKQTVEEEIKVVADMFDKYVFALQKLVEYAQVNEESFKKAMENYHENVVKSKDKGMIEAFEGPVIKHLIECVKAIKASTNPNYEQWQADLEHIKNINR